MAGTLGCKPMGWLRAVISAILWSFHTGLYRSLSLVKQICGVVQLIYTVTNFSYSYTLNDVFQCFNIWFLCHAVNAVKHFVDTSTVVQQLPFLQYLFHADQINHAHIWRYTDLTTLGIVYKHRYYLVLTNGALGPMLWGRISIDA